MRGDAWTIFSREQMEREKMKDAALLVSRSLHETPLVTGGKLAGAAVLAAFSVVVVAKGMAG